MLQKSKSESSISVPFFLNDFEMISMSSRAFADDVLRLEEKVEKMKLSNEQEQVAGAKEGEQVAGAKEVDSDMTGGENVSN